MNRIDLIFNKLKEENKKALIPFVANGDPTLDETVQAVLKLEKAGASIVEIGVPFSDPLADGPVIQNAYTRALKGGIKVKDIFICGRKIREQSEIPLVIMIYYNLVHHYGVDEFLKEAGEAGFDGLIIPDIPLEERGELKEMAESNGVYLIPLVAPTSKQRIEKITNGAKGFVYCVSSNGTTGERSVLSRDITDYLNIVKTISDVPICLGFGISSKEVVKQVKEFCDGVIIGSAIIRRMSESRDNAYEFIEEIRKEIDL
ncbi:tryptophan synthase subunit alpha [Clostridium uliginosum]|uniref:Tryptophan synthase alpha chain n=1 Tax=Clostridium uliginosum TaxID=119641 RepID=A0A1I1H4K3_9CLOT|nr:tryptophan synthase subunit alpha [Clostridium uliginosum]SFC18884.1 tryptophan synthase, alpha chain [Clostridium uliginosum]